ncbi:hypothetical protein AMS68_003447 [Peltaster fructicola]|uniref:Uncharacterized protein n=1 Tax=Peltaster fructicola TaxID=286661 RepID=A0A6H0XU00_9PEZI|nr:hypothetical protein AMS68_003447 [Peltaster fructicola]
MTNNLVGDVYQKIIEEVVAASANDFEESAVPQTTLNELRQAWQAKLSQRGVAQMPWDPRPDAPPRIQNGNITSSKATPAPSYQQYGDGEANGTRVKLEPTDQSYSSAAPAGNYAPVGPQQGGIARAQELVQERFGQQAAAAIQRPGGLALPGQQPKPQGLQLPGQSQQQAQQQAQQQYAQQQQSMMARQQAALQQQQMNPRIKVENDGSNMPQGQYAPQQQRMPNPAYAQTDGADEYAQWDEYIAQRRAMHASQVERNDHIMRDRISALSSELESGLMVPLDRANKRKQRHYPASQAGPSSSSTIAQYDGVDDDDEDVKEAAKAEYDDEDAINSDLDDPDDDQNPIGDDEDELGDTILCTYDKVQRVKNKWKCTLKDGVLNTGGKEWLFHKGQGEFEW